VEIKRMRCKEIKMGKSSLIILKMKIDQLVNLIMLIASSHHHKFPSRI